MKKQEIKKIEKVISNIDIQLQKLEMELQLVPVEMKGEIWNSYVRTSKYKKQLKTLISK